MNNDTTSYDTNDSPLSFLSQIPVNWLKGVMFVQKVVAVCQPAPVSYCLCVVDNWSKWHTLLVDYGDQYIIGVFSSV